MTREEFEDRLKENPLNDHLLQVVEQTLTPDNTETRIALDTDREKVYWIYFNPDSTAGGQYVSGELDFNVFKELIDQYDIENHPENAEQFAADLEEMSDQFLADINTPFFAEAENEYEGTTVYTGFTSENILQIYEAILSYETDRDAERDLNRHEAEFGADGTRVFRDTEERQVQPETGPFIDHYYVVEDLAAAPLSVTEYPDREEALEAYFALPTDTMKAFGVVNTKELPGSLDFIQCRDGKDTLIEDYAKTDDDSWRNPEIEGLIDQLKEKLAERDKPIAPPPQKQRSGKVTPHVLLPEINTEYRTNFRIERDDIGVGTPLERFHHNRMAIQLLKKLDDEHRLADTNEQRILADYVGWGGLSDYFKEDNPHYEAPPDEQNFPMVMEMIRAGDVKENNEDYLSVLDELFERLEAKNPEHIALKYYRAYHSGSAKTLKSIQISLVSRLEKFNLDSLAGITQTDEMDLGEIGERKTAVFAVIPDNDSSFNFIVGMLYTQLFQQLYYQADSVHGGRLPVHVHFVMDEFANETQL